MLLQVKYCPARWIRLKLGLFDRYFIKEIGTEILRKIHPTPTSEISVKIPRHLVQLLVIRILIPNAVKKIHRTIEKAAKALVS